MTLVVTGRTTSLASARVCVASAIRLRPDAPAARRRSPSAIASPCHPLSRLPRRRRTSAPEGGGALSQRNRSGRPPVAVSLHVRGAPSIPSRRLPRSTAPIVLRLGVALRRPGTTHGFGPSRSTPMPSRNELDPSGRAIHRPTWSTRVPPPRAHPRNCRASPRYHFIRGSGSGCPLPCGTSPRDCSGRRDRPAWPPPGTIGAPSIRQPPPLEVGVEALRVHFPARRP